MCAHSAVCKLEPFVWLGRREVTFKLGF
eukprot:COSAG05_NODE_2184_length_3428_cov_9.880445_5_plen_27_part_01